MKKVIATVLLLNFIFLVTSCSNQKTERLDTEEVREWVNYAETVVPWEAKSNIKLKEFPGVKFQYTPLKVIAIKGLHKETLIGNASELGGIIINVFLTDLNGDNLPEFCATVAVGSGIMDKRVIVYDYAAQKRYELSDRAKFDYTLSIQDDRLIVTQSAYQGSKIADGFLVLDMSSEDPSTTILTMAAQ